MSTKGITVTAAFKAGLSWTPENSHVDFYLPRHSKQSTNNKLIATAKKFIPQKI